MPNKFVSLFFANGCHRTPSKAIVFKRDSTSSAWQDPEQHPIECEGNFSEMFRNAFLIKNKQGADCLLLFRDEHCLAFKLDDMEQIAKVSYRQDKISALIQNYCTTTDFSSNGSTWLMTFQVGNDVVTEQMAVNQFVGNTMQNTWCMRWKLESDCTISPINPKTESIHFKTEAVQGCCEFAPGKMIFFARQEHLFVVHNWKVVGVIRDRDTKNINKYSITPFPGFDANTFPFVVTSGDSTFNLVNVKTGQMDVLINVSTTVQH